MPEGMVLRNVARVLFALTAATAARAGQLADHLTVGADGVVGIKPVQSAGDALRAKGWQGTGVSAPPSGLLLLPLGKPCTAEPGRPRPIVSHRRSPTSWT